MSTEARPETFVVTCKVCGSEDCTVEVSAHGDDGDHWAHVDINCPACERWEEVIVEGR